MNNTVKVSVVVISYNQEQYIAECLEGIFAQKGDFKIELVIGDDCSTDTTLEIIKNYADNLCDNRVQVRILAADGNVGMTRNLQRCLDACTGNYIAVCEGDDYWIDSYKLQKQLNFLKSHPECALCFNDIYLYFQESGELSTFELQRKLDAEVITTKALVSDYYIGNLSCCMYDAKYMKKIPIGLFDLYIGDWMFNIYYSQFGDIGHLKDIMSVYRKHSQGVWAGKDPAKAAIELHTYIDGYNKFLNYDFDAEFSVIQKNIEAAHPDVFYKDPVDIAIIDDVFPHPLSAFRFQEFRSYLKEFGNLKVYSSGSCIHVLGKATLDELFAEFKRKFPEYAGQIKKFGSETIINAKLFYFVFLGNAYAHIEKVEELRTPFVFTLYPGGGFGLDNARSDMMLKRVTSSPCFRKVIVSQKVTYDYLIEKNLCAPDRIEFIFGVVTPIEHIEVDYMDKIRFGIDKNILDICFVAHKYTEKGVDKGYDVFIDVAKELCKKYDNICFHVVGGFDENAIDVSDIKKRITFYGNRDMEWFDEFYKDKDIILSPNIPFMIAEGTFDGFPTGACVDAGLRKTALFCADELHQNTPFVDGEEIVIIPHDVRRVTDIIESYYQNPDKIRTIAENGCRKIKHIYSFEAQIQSRINILKKELEQAERSKEAIFAMMSSVKLNFRQRSAQLAFSALMSLKRICPAWIKSLFMRILLKISSNEALFNFIKRICPEFLIRIYIKVLSSP